MSRTTKECLTHAQRRHTQARQQLEEAEAEIRLLSLGLVGEQVESKIKELEETRKLIDAIPRPLSLDVTKMINDSERDIRSAIENLQRLKKRFDQSGVTAYTKNEIPGGQ